MPVVIRPVIVIYTVALAAIFLVIAQWIVYRQIIKLDWLEGVKVKE